MLRGRSELTNEIKLLVLRHEVVDYVEHTTVIGRTALLISLPLTRDGTVRTPRR